MIIVCDVDGTLNNLMQATLDLYNEQYGASYTLDDITAYNLEDCFDLAESKRMKDIFNDPSVWESVKPTRGSQEALQKLISSGHQVYLATDNDPNTYGEKVAWIKQFYPFIDSSKIICIKDKWMLRADIMIEDCLQNLLAKPYYHRILMDSPWNKHVHDDVYDINRCSNWDSIVGVVNKINEKE